MAIKGLGYNAEYARIINSELQCIEAARTRAADLTKQLSDYAPAPVRELVKLSKFKGSESANIIINAMGTAAAALPIYFNPVTKTDDDTLFYMCMRQPISALVAFATQIPATMWLARKIGEHHNMGYCSPVYDKRIVQDEGFILRQLKKENKEKSLGLGLDELKSKASSIRAKQEYDAIADMLKEGTFVTRDHSGKIVYRLPDEDFKRLLTDVADGYIKENEKHLQRHYSEKISKQIARGVFINNNPELADSLLNEVKEAYERVSKNAQKDTAESKELINWFKAKIKQVKKGNSNVEQQIGILKDLHDRRTLTAILKKIGELEAQVEQFKNCDDPMKIVLDNIRQEDVDLKKTINISNKIKELVKNNADIKDIIVTAREITGVNFSYDLLQKHLSRITSAGRYKSAVVGLIASFIITFGTCSVLNWVYPKIMDLFPSVKEAKRKAESRKHNYDDKVAFTRRTFSEKSSLKEVKNA